LAPKKKRSLERENGVVNDSGGRCPKFERGEDLPREWEETSILPAKKRGM